MRSAARARPARADPAWARPFCGAALRSARTRRLVALLFAAAAFLAAGAWLVDTAAARPEATRAAKIRLLKRLSRGPELIIFGSSRAMKADPRVIRGMTRARGFNAAVSSGTPADAFALMHLAHDLFPDTQPRYLWIIDMEQLRRSRLQPKLLTVPDLVAYLPQKYQPKNRAAGAAANVPAAETLSSDDGALGNSWTTRAGTRTKYSGKRMVYRSDGFVTWGMRDYWASRGLTLEMCLASTILHFGDIYPKGFRAIRSTPALFLRETIKQMNEWGVRPVIVLSPYHPDLRRSVSGRGWAKRHKQVRQLFRHLQARLDFVFLDFTSIKTFGGKASGFYDGIHPRRSLAAKMLRAAVRRARKDLVPVPAPTPTPTPTSEPTPPPEPTPTPDPTPTPSPAPGS
jgi:hypothetical protein